MRRAVTLEHSIHHLDAAGAQRRFEGPRCRAADIARAVHLHQARHCTAVRTILQLMADQSGLQQYASREIQRMEIVFRDDWQLHVREQAGQPRLLAEMMHRRPVAAADSGDHGEHGLRCQMLLQLGFPGLGRPLQFPHMQLPGAHHLEHLFAVAVHPRTLEPGSGIFLGEEIIEHRQRGGPLHRIGIGRDDGRELQHLVTDSGHRFGRELSEVGDERSHRSIIQSKARHQPAERFARDVHAIAYRTRQ